MNSSTMDSLPDEVLLIIWVYVDLHDVLAAKRVCRRWERLLSRRALHVRRPSDEQRVQPALKQLFVTARRTNLLNMLSITRCLHTLIAHERVSIDTNDIKLICDAAPHLEHLDTFFEYLDSRDLSAVQRLKTFVINDIALPSLLRGLEFSTQLTQFHMYGRSLYYVPRGMAQMIAANRHRLTELTLRCHELSEAGYLEIGRCTELVVARLYGCWLLRQEAAMGLVCSPKLQVLHLTGTHMLRSKQIFQLIAVLPKRLVELVLSSTRFGDEHVTALADRLPNLLILELWNTPATADSLFRLAMKLRRLQEFDIDKELWPSHLEELSMHPSLMRLRCAKPCKISNLLFQKAAGRLAPVVTPNARYGRGTMRPSGDGWRSSLFYHWSVNRQPQPLTNDNILPHNLDRNSQGPDSGLANRCSCLTDSAESKDCIESSKESTSENLGAMNLESFTKQGNSDIDIPYKKRKRSKNHIKENKT